MKKTLALLLLILSLTFCNAIAVIGPAVYVATLSITAFLANTIITVAIFVAAKTVSNKNTLSKGISSKISLALEIIGKIALLIISTTLAILIVNPILISEAILTGVIAAIICGIILFLYNYKKLSISEKQTKRGIIISTALFCIFVLISSTLVGYYSIEIKPVVVNGQGVEQKLAQESSSPLLDSAEGFVANKSQSSPAPILGIQQEEIRTPQSLIFIPKNTNLCIITTEKETFTIQPKNNCFSTESGYKQRILCPIVISDEGLSIGSIVNSSGSCTNTYTIK
jgi:hypothetical protein